MNTLIKAASVWVCLGLLSQAAQATLIEGIEFPDGSISFADAVVSYTPGPDAGPGYDDPSAALGTPDHSGTNADGTAVALGDGGELVVRFTDNSLTTSGDATADLHIFEDGPVVEWMIISISTNGLDWIEIGELKGQPTSIDIDAVAGVTHGTLYSFVRLVDNASNNQTGSPFGEADIDAIGAISSGAAVDLPLPGTIWLSTFLLSALAFNDRLARNR